MEALDFKTRFATAVGEVPDWIEFDPTAFVTFDPQALQRIPLQASDVELLSKIGMPKSTAPMLEFGALQTNEIDALWESSDIPREFFPIGHNNYGDHICVSGESGEVVYFEHDSHPPRKVFINSSLLHFAECICVFQALVVAGRTHDAPDPLRQVDPRAMQPGAMWYSESGGLPPSTSLERTRD